MSMGVFLEILNQAILIAIAIRGQPPGPPVGGPREPGAAAADLCLYL